jgi:hypothetical protein
MRLRDRRATAIVLAAVVDFSLIKATRLANGTNL